MMNLATAIEMYASKECGEDCPCERCRAGKDEELENKRIRIYRKRENTAERESYKAFKAYGTSEGARKAWDTRGRGRLLYHGTTDAHSGEIEAGGLKHGMLTDSLELAKEEAERHANRERFEKGVVSKPVVYSVHVKRGEVSTPSPIESSRRGHIGNYYDRLKDIPPERVRRYLGIKAEVGTPGAGNTGTGNLVEPQPKNDVPSLKKRKRVMTDEEQEREEEKVMPDAAKKRKRYRQERAGKSGGLQVW